MNESTKKLQISKDTYKAVAERDGKCIYCGTYYNLECAHYIGRAQLGMGVEQNLAMLCHDCHTALDNGNNTALREDIKKVFRQHLKEHYPNTHEADLIYKKWR